MTSDLLNRLTNVTDALGTTKFTYTDAGQLLSEDGPWADDAVSYSYNARRRAGLSLAQPNASAWSQSYLYDQYDRLTNVTSAAGKFSYTYWIAGVLSDRVAFQGLAGDYGVDAPSYIQNDYDYLARLTGTRLYGGPWASYLNHHSYTYNAANQRTRQTFMENTTGNYVDYTYDDIGQLKTAKGSEAGGTARLNEQFGYAYDKAWNLERRTNNALVQTFGVNNLNELTNATRTGTLTVAGPASQPGANISSVSVSGTGLTTGNADIYADGSWAKTGASLNNGANTFSATATDTYGRTASDTINLSLPSTNNFQYDFNGNLTNDGRRVFEYDYENQLTNVYVASAWRSEFKYDAFGRRRVRKEYTWQSSAWVLTNEVRYVYDGMLVVQERDANNLARVSYTRDNDLSGTLQGAGGIGGLLARSEMSNLQSPHAYYHADGNGNVTALVDTNGILVAKYNYDPYGNLLGMSGPMAEANTYRFSSKEYAGNAGLYYYGYRFYEPNLQRWLNRDPILEAGGVNLFAFVLNSPFSIMDLLGLAPNKAEACNDTYVKDFLELNGSLDELANDVLQSGSRYFYTDKYGWIDIRHFATAASRVQNGEPGWLTGTFGFLLEINQWLNEWGDDYRSGFSPEDLPSNRAGIDFANSRSPLDGSLADTFERWAAVSGKRGIGDPKSGYQNLPDKDPSFKGGKGKGSDSTSSNPNAEVELYKDSCNSFK